MMCHSGVDISQPPPSKIIPYVSPEHSSSEDQVQKSADAQSMATWDPKALTKPSILNTPDADADLDDFAEFAQPLYMKSDAKNMAMWDQNELTMPSIWPPDADVDLVLENLGAIAKPLLSTSPKADFWLGCLRTQTPGGKLNRKARKVYGSLRFQCSLVADAARRAMMASEFFSDVELDTNSRGNWFLIAHVFPEYFQMEEQILIATKTMLLDASEQSDVCFVLGHKDQPFVNTSDGFTALLAAVTAVKPACRHFMAYGSCAWGNDCKWGHPALGIALNVRAVLHVSF